MESCLIICIALIVNLSKFSWNYNLIHCHPEQHHYTPPGHHAVIAKWTLSDISLDRHIRLLSAVAHLCRCDVPFKQNFIAIGVNEYNEMNELMNGVNDITEWRPASQRLSKSFLRQNTAKQKPLWSCKIGQIVALIQADRCITSRRSHCTIGVCRRRVSR